MDVRQHHSEADDTVEKPRIGIVLSAYNEERYIDRALDAIEAQDYPADRVTIVVVDGGSTDRTVEILQRRAAANPRIHLVADGVRRNLPEALCVGIALLDVEYVAKIDAHGYPERDFLSRAILAFAQSPGDVACVGGRPRQIGETEFGRALALARTSRFGVGSSGYANKAEFGFVDTVQCGVYRRRALVEVGGFDPAMNFGEDEEANWRLRRAGYRIVLDTRIQFHYFPRPTWVAAYRQYRNYGRARVAVIRKHPNFLKVHHLAPAVAVCGAALGLTLATAWRPARFPFAAAAAVYMGAALLTAKALSDSAETASPLRVASAFAALHAGYGVGMVQGILRELVPRQ